MERHCRERRISIKVVECKEKTLGVMLPLFRKKRLLGTEIECHSRGLRSISKKLQGMVQKLGIAAASTG